MNIELSDMALFVEVVKAMSFRGAAMAIGVPNSTLSRRISALEKAIGLRLLHRTTRRIELTEAGRIYFERCKRIVDEARLAHEQLGDMLAQPSGVLRASLPVGFANAFLAPLIAEFASRYPAITFEFDLSPRRADLITEPVDVAIRMGESPNSNLISRQITQLPRHLYAAPRYIEGAGELSHPRDLAAHDCLRLRSGQTDIWTLLHSRESVAAPVQAAFS
jgi:DNA-binding transcriptional LysR family regulator